MFASFPVPVTAVDYGGQPGLGAGDAILIVFDVPVATVAVDTPPTLSALVAVSPSSWAAAAVSELRQALVGVSYFRA